MELFNSLRKLVYGLCPWLKPKEQPLKNIDLDLRSPRQSRGDRPYRPRGNEAHRDRPARGRGGDYRSRDRGDRPSQGRDRDRGPRDSRGPRPDNRGPYRGDDRGNRQFDRGRGPRRFDNRRPAPGAPQNVRRESRPPQTQPEQTREPAKPAPERKFFVGVVTHYFDKASVAVIKLQKGSMQVNDQIAVEGPQTQLKQKVQSMQIDHQPIQVARVGQEVGLLVNQPVQEGDQVFRV